MVDNDCPCCQPPTQIQRGRSSEFIYVIGAENVGSSPVYALVWKVTEGGTLTRFYPGTANTAPMASRGNGGIDADRQGNCYFSLASGTASATDVYCIDPTGVMKWNTALQVSGTNINDVPGLAVSADGHVYASNSATGTIWKIDANTGAEITSGWPYRLTGASLMGGLCVDQAGNVYAGGARNSGVPGNTMVSLTPAGAVRWAIDLLGPSESAAGNITDIEINLDNTELVVTKRQSSSTNSDYFEIDPATGTILGSHKSAQFNGVACADYSIAGHRYIGGQIGVLQDGVTSPKFYAPAGRTFSGMAVSRTEDLYLVQTKSGSVTDEGIVRVDTTGTKVWGVSMTTANLPTRCVLGSGHIGAWGL